MCVPRAGAAKWGLSPRVVLGDTSTGPGRRQPRWDGLMPSISGVAGQGMVVNLGHLPFRHPVEGYLPVLEMAHADARFVLQVYDDASRMWRDVRPRYKYCSAVGRVADFGVDAGWVGAVSRWRVVRGERERERERWSDWIGSDRI